MKAELGPKHTQQIGNNYVLWFEISNKYVVISSTAYLLLNCYFDSTDEKGFNQHLKEYFNIPKKQGETYYTDFSNFLTEVNAKSKSLELTVKIKSIPISGNYRYYSIGETKISIKFSSDKLLQLIHPYFQHTSLDNINANVKFDIFSDDKVLYLFKNNTFIGSYESSNFYFLQGKFSMELVMSIYNNLESDWLASFHASTVCNDKEAIMIIGESGSGKSTLSAVLMAHGFDLLADDFTPMLAKNQHLYRFPAAISIKEGAFAMIENLYEEFDSIKPQVSSSKPITVKYLPPSSPFENSIKHFPCTKLVMVKYTKDAPSKLQECSPEKMLQTFIPDSWISPKSAHSKVFMNWLKDLKFYELTYSDNNFAIKKFEELFEL